MEYETETYTYSDLSSLKVGKGSNNSDTGVSSIKDVKWVVKKRILPPVVKEKNSPGAPATWIDRYFMNIRYRLRRAHDGSLKITRSEIKEPSIDLQYSLKMFFQVAACDAHDWTDVNRSYRARRSFPTFLNLLKLSGLGKYAFNEDTFLQDDDMNIRYPQDRYWLPHKVSPDVVVANKYYDGSFSLMRLLQRIHSESADQFRQEQARLLDSFLDILIKIQQEQRFIAKSFSEHLEQLRKSGEVAFSSNPVNDDDGDRPKCPIISSDNTMDSYMWQQKHLLDSLCIMSRESVWLLKKLKDTPFTSPSSILEFNKILDIVLVFIPKFKKSKELLDQRLLMLYPHTISDPIRLIVGNNEILHSFRGCIKDLQEQGVERNSLAETLLGCFVDVVNMYYNLADLGDPFGDTCSSIQYSFSEAAKQTSELINEAVDKLNSVRFSDLTGGGSPLGCIALWRILFESSLINLRLDLICKKHSETVEHGVKLFGTATNDQLDQIRLSIDELLTVGESVLVEFIAMHKTVAEVSYMLGDAFTTGGAGMRGLSDVTHPCKHNDQLMDFNPEDFPWDKHNVPSSTIGPNSKDWPKCYEDYE
ncbi:hypothetical protein C5167_040033 [Papaver somniferum]|uniref:Uncharacterized protein n=1 Tax=Papaver somniferum TaxID=3469 RepID=A0A4Y7IDZ7_PAPSO|nr:uncharacterized protein LOC113312727 [Papaver somniferum]XP_026417258.1 uncharacterized protein LOC113312727 [Papaver somniferum]RZC47084.1 hypothetical protein C5167_040033 [Papaver somniferum]